MLNCLGDWVHVGDDNSASTAAAFAAADFCSLEIGFVQSEPLSQSHGWIEGALFQNHLLTIEDELNGMPEFWAVRESTLARAEHYKIIFVKFSFFRKDVKTFKISSKVLKIVMSKTMKCSENI